MISLTSIDNVKVTIIDSNHIDTIDVHEWVKLANNCQHKNPFFEHWNLIPAINNLHDNKKIKIVTVNNNGRLAALFPVYIEPKPLFTYLKIWHHQHCYDSTPIFSREINIQSVFDTIIEHYNVSFLLINTHKIKLASTENPNILSAAYSRAYINTSEKIDTHIQSFPGKQKRELNRLQKRLQENATIQYSEHDNAIQGINEYCELEDNSWKRPIGGSINASKPTRNYYDELAKLSQGAGKLSFQILTANNSIIAMAMRIKLKSHYYEIKTSYHSDFKQYAPGKILEYKILHALSSETGIEVDSCTHHNNAFINRLWPDQVSIFRTFVFSKNLRGRLLNTLYSLKQFFSKKEYQ